MLNATTTLRRACFPISNGFLLPVVSKVVDFQITVISKIQCFPMPVVSQFQWFPNSGGFRILVVYTLQLFPKSSSFRIPVERVLKYFAKTMIFFTIQFWYTVFSHLLTYIVIFRNLLLIFASFRSHGSTEARHIHITCLLSLSNRSTTVRIYIGQWRVRVLGEKYLCRATSMELCPPP